MANQWYYGVRDNSRQGPFSDRQLRALAAEGRIQPLDTIWKEGVEQGVPAHEVKNLLPLDPESADVSAAPLDPPAPPTAPGASPVDEGTGDEVEASTAAADEAATPEEVAPPPKPHPASPRPRKGRALALKGAIIVGQDGEVVYFNRLCVVCGHKDAGRSRMPIRPGMTRGTYFCPKCKKARPLEILGTA